MSYKEHTARNQSSGVIVLSDILTSEQPIKGDVKQTGYGDQQREIGIGATLLPFGDGLCADTKIKGKLPLCHAALQSQLSDVAAKWNFQNKTSCEDVCRTQDVWRGILPLLLASRDGRGVGEQYGMLADGTTHFVSSPPFLKFIVAADPISTVQHYCNITTVSRQEPIALPLVVELFQKAPFGIPSPN